MKLRDLIADFEYEVLSGDIDRDIHELQMDSRKVADGDVFVCIPGANRDGHDFAAQVVENGASAIIVEHEVDLGDTKNTPTIVKVASSRHALACASAAFFGYPARELKTIGITGTKGKTTTTYMVREALEGVGVKTGLIGTIETIIGEERTPSANTTPESYVVQQTFRKMVDAGLEAVVMEVSSQGLMMERVGGFTFDIGVFTNLSADHIGPNEHKDFEDYMNCKALLFKACKKGIFNIDDEHAKDMMKQAICEIETYSTRDEKATLYAKNISLFTEPGVLGVAYDIEGSIETHVKIDVPGDFSVYNSLAAISICRLFTEDTKKIVEALEKIRVRGRVEIVPVSDDFTVMVDYAHNAMSLESLLNSLKNYEHNRLVTVFGCGGNRDRNRRFEMGEVSGRIADFTVVTSDNPRDEGPEGILVDIETGLARAGLEKGSDKYVTIADRYEAIRFAIANAKKGDVIIVAGKGHEDYQIIKGVKYHMDDRELIAQAKEELGI